MDFDNSKLMSISTKTGNMTGQKQPGVLNKQNINA